MSDLLIDAETLLQVLPDPDWIVFDVRYVLSDPRAGRQAYLNGHIPGACFLDQGAQLAGQSDGTNGRHPLPEPELFRQLLHRHGANADSNIVVYDDNDGSFAARAWWLLRWQGYARTRVLDGGLQAWKNAGGALDSTVPPRPGGGTEAMPPHHSGPGQAPVKTMPIVAATDILARPASGVGLLVDARTPERYRGDVEPIDPVAGRIGDALNRPIASNVQADGRFKQASQLHDEFKALLGGTSADQVVHYCGSGITACHNVFAMELAGLRGSALYPGSWSEWSSDPERPVARG